MFFTFLDELNINYKTSSNSIYFYFNLRLEKLFKNMDKNGDGLVTKQVGLELKLNICIEFIFDINVFLSEIVL